jgi:hypothetical protein
MLGLNFFVEPEKENTYWIGVDVHMPQGVTIAEDTTLVIADGAVVRKQFMEIVQKDNQQYARILMHVFSRIPQFKGYLKTVVCSDYCTPQKIAFELDFKKGAHFYHDDFLSKSWMSRFIYGSGNLAGAILVTVLVALFIMGALSLLIFGFIFSMYLVLIIGAVMCGAFVIFSVSHTAQYMYNYCKTHIGYAIAHHQGAKPSSK